MSKSICLSYVHYEEKCWRVSTIEREYYTFEGRSMGEETLAWEYDQVNKRMGKQVYQGCGLNDHIEVCRSLINDGEIPKDSK